MPSLESTAVEADGSRTGEVREALQLVAGAGGAYLLERGALAGSQCRFGFCNNLYVVLGGFKRWYLHCQGGVLTGFDDPNVATQSRQGSLDDPSLAARTRSMFANATRVVVQPVPIDRAPCSTVYASCGRSLVGRGTSSSGPSFASCCEIGRAHV